MTSGKSLHPEERQYVLDHAEDGPGRIAWQLGRLFPQHNNGYRNPQVVSKIIYRAKQPQEVILHIPVETIRMFKAANYGREDLRYMAEQYLANLAANLPQKSI